MPHPCRTIHLLIACSLLAALTWSSASARQERNPLPESTPATGDASWGIADMHPLNDLDGQPIALSPDGQWIAGTDDDSLFCVWDVASRETACDTERLPIHAESIAWSPDSTAVAYSLDAFIRFEESDIFVFELDTGSSENLTPDGVDEILGGQATDGPIPIDVLPAWSADSQTLTFARTDFAADPRGTDLMTIDRAGGAPERRFTVADDLPLAIFTSMFSLADGSLLYAVSPVEPGRAEQGLWHLDADGEAGMILAGAGTDAFPIPAIVDVVETGGGTRISGYSMHAIGDVAFEGPFSFVMDLESGEVLPLVHPLDESILLQPAAFSPDGVWMIAAPLTSGKSGVVLIGPGSQAIPLDPERALPGSRPIRQAPDWAADNTVLVAGFVPNRAFLFTLEPGTGATPEAP